MPENVMTTMFKPKNVSNNSKTKNKTCCQTLVTEVDHQIMGSYSFACPEKNRLYLAWLLLLNTNKMKRLYIMMVIR